MTIFARSTDALHTIIVLVLVVILLGSILGQPMGVAYVKTESMEPTLSPGDGFIAIPIPLSGSIEEGDVVVFESERIGGGEATTHRVVDITDRGYITRGDANPVTDQDGGEPPVKRGQVVAKAMRVNGQVVVIPALGVIVEGTQSVLSLAQRTLATIVGSRSLLGTQGLAYLFFMATLGWYAVGKCREKNTKRRERGQSRVERLDIRLVVAAFACILVIGATATMMVPSGTQEFGVVSAEFQSERPNVIPSGESKRRPYLVANGGVLPVATFFEPASEGVELDMRQTVVPARSTVENGVTLHAPSDTGYYRRYVTEHRYLAVLPLSTIQLLYELHPWAPIVVIDALIGVPFYVLGVRLAGRARIRRDRSRKSRQTVLARVRGFLTDRY